MKSAGPDLPNNSLTAITREGQFGRIIRDSKLSSIRDLNNRLAAGSTQRHQINYLCQHLS